MKIQSIVIEKTIHERQRCKKTGFWSVLQYYFGGYDIRVWLYPAWECPLKKSSWEFLNHQQRSAPASDTRRLVDYFASLVLMTTHAFYDHRVKMFQTLSCQVTHLNLKKGFTKNTFHITSANRGWVEQTGNRLNWLKLVIRFPCRSVNKSIPTCQGIRSTWNPFRLKPW